MRLLLDENLSPRLVRALAVEYPGSTHVESIGLRGRPDADIWNYARVHGFTLVSKDTDFRHRSFVEGAPPKIIWLDVGNAGTNPIIELLKREVRSVHAFTQHAEASLLVLSMSARSS